MGIAGVYQMPVAAHQAPPERPVAAGRTPAGKGCGRPEKMAKIEIFGLR